MRNKTWIPTAIVLGLSVMPLPSMAGTLAGNIPGVAPVGMLLSQPAGPARAAKSASGTSEADSQALQGAASAGQLAQAQSQAALLQATLEIVTLEAKIKKVEAGKSDKSTPMQGANPVTSPYPIMGMPVPGANPQPIGNHPTNAVQAHSRVQAPRVLSLMGAGTHYTATLALPDGTIMSARPGMALGGGWKVTQVNSDGVLATHNGKVEPLAFSAQSGQGIGMGNGGQTAPSFTPPNMGMGAPLLPNGAPMQITPPTGLPPVGLPGQGG
jgi:type IV pilus biogenesis protein PilP